MQRCCDLSGTRTLPNRKDLATSRCAHNTSLAVLSPRDHNSTPANLHKFPTHRRGTSPRKKFEYLASAIAFAQSAAEQIMRSFMSAQQAIDDLVRMLRARARRYKVLAEGLYDRQTAAEVSAYAVE